jgi:DNA-binding NarL/FixJ family response regulator
MDVVLASAKSDLRFALEVLLREQPGVSVVGTATGASGLLALIDSTSPDLVILDRSLPGRPWPDLLTAVCAGGARPCLIVLGKDQAARQEALGAGADAFVQLGDPPDSLLEAVEAARTLKEANAPVSGKKPARAEAKGE